MQYDRQSVAESACLKDCAWLLDADVIAVLVHLDLGAAVAQGASMLRGNPTYIERARRSAERRLRLQNGREFPIDIGEAAITGKYRFRLLADV